MDIRQSRNSRGEHRLHIGFDSWQGDSSGRRNGSLALEARFDFQCRDRITTVMTTTMKTMNTIKYMGMALIMAALASCSSDDDFGTNWQNDPTAVRVSATVGGVFTRSNPVAEEELTNFKKTML